MRSVLCTDFQATRGQALAAPQVALLFQEYQINGMECHSTYCRCQNSMLCPAVGDVRHAPLS